MQYITSYFIKIAILFLFLFTVVNTGVEAAINFTVTPIRYELQVQPGGTITRTASIRNNGTTPVTLGTTVSDFEARDTGGTPQIVRRSELVHLDQQLSTWITLSESSITLAAGEEGTIEFRIDVPTDATPGGHYGAVLFKHDGSQASSGGNIGIDVDYGVILLVEVAGDIIIDIDIEEPLISNKVGYGYRSFGPDSPVWNFPISQDPTSDGWFLGEDDSGTPLYQLPDTCPLGDFSGNRYDGRCFPWEPLLFTESEGLLFSNDFGIEFSFPIVNKGNTHVRPTGKVVLRDEDGNIIPGIGKEALANEFGAVIGERVVDYIPINDEQGNVLPGSKRIFTVDWKGFPYQDFDERGNIVIRYWTPSEYYTRLGQRESGYLMPWEIVSEVRTNRNITADIELRYTDIDGNEQAFNAAKEFPIQYREERIILNPYVLLGFLLLIPILLMLIGALWWWIAAKREKKCWNCGEKIKAHWKTCPHCQAIQDKKQHRKVQKILESQTKEKKK